MLITQGIKNKTRNLARGSGLDSGDGGDCMTGVEELEEQVSAKGGRTPCGHPARSSKLLVQNRKTSNAGPSRSMSYSLRKFDFTNFQSNPASIRYEYRPLSICFCVLIFLRKSTRSENDCCSQKSVLNQSRYKSTHYRWSFKRRKLECSGMGHRLH